MWHRIFIGIIQSCHRNPMGPARMLACIYSCCDSCMLALQSVLGLRWPFRWVPLNKGLLANLTS